MSFSIYENLCKNWRVQHHLIKLTQSLLSQLKWDIFPIWHTCQTSVPSDYHLIPGLKRDLGSRHFATEEDLHNAVAKFFAKQDAEWYSAGITPQRPF